MCVCVCLCLCVCVCMFARMCVHVSNSKHEYYVFLINIIKCKLNKKVPF